LVINNVIGLAKMAKVFDAEFARNPARAARVLPLWHL